VVNPAFPFVCPPLRFPDELPITAHREAIADALARSRVLIVCGDTGSGKTTQLPKIALAAGRGRQGLIGVTQPRRLAAVAMATRVAEEFGGEPGGFVGVQHRFERRLSSETRIKFMTDGILLAETRQDRLLRAYDTLIIDEAHERSLNIDFLLGILRGIIPRRPDLRVVISSATLDAERFAAFFADRGAPAPVFTIPGRLYPVEVRYRPADEEDAPDLPRMIANAADELAADAPGDVLVFLPGERDIREAADVLSGRRLPDTAIIPLLASLPAGEQQRAFKTIPGVRRIILATNVAETSVTLPGIRAVIDTGLARVPRWNARTRVQRLQIEAISQASASQRSGRCGRLGPGVCIRLYSADDLANRPPYTDPEIVRSSLAGVILTMLDLRLGDIATFPFLDPPPPTAIRDGLRELIELGAIGHHDAPPGEQPDHPRPPAALTPLGIHLARLPLEPRLARILFAADAEKALRHALIVVAALECDDPRRRPVEKQAEADAAHAQFLTPASDFSALLRLWRWYDDQGGFTSNTTARRLCRDHFLSFPRMREWRDLRDQLERLVRPLGLDPATEAGGDAGLHRALLTGLLGHIGKRDPETGDYRGAHGLRFALFPGSGLAKAARQAGKRKQSDPAADAAPPTRPSPTALPVSREWVIAGELVETARLYARTAACIDLAWIEPIAGRLCKSSFHSPWWDADKGFARIRERVTLHGLVLVENRTRDYARINPADARSMFIRHGLIAGEFPNPPAIIRDNLSRLAVLRLAQAKTRSGQSLLDEDAVYAFYDARLPADVPGADALRRWLRQASSEQVESFRLTDADIPLPDGAATGFPDTLTLDGHSLPLTYRHAPGEPDDGITCTVPADLLPRLRAWRADWLVPGALPEKIRWMLASLPSKTRRLVAPPGETADRCLGRMPPGREPLAQALSRALYEICGVRIPSETWREDDLPDWLRIRFVVTAPNAPDAPGGKTLGTGRTFDLLLKTFAPSTAAPVDAASRKTGIESRFHRDGITDWSVGDLPEEVTIGRAGWPIVHYPALVDTSPAACALRLFSDAATAAAIHAEGTLRLIALALGPDILAIRRASASAKELRGALAALDYTPESLGADILRATLHACFLEDLAPVRSEAVFRQRLLLGRPKLGVAHLQIARLCASVLHEAQILERALGGEARPIPAAAPPSVHTAESVLRDFSKRPEAVKPPAPSAPVRADALATFADLLISYNRQPDPGAPPLPSKRSAARPSPTVTLHPAAADDLRDQLAWLVYPGFIRATPWGRLQHYPRYLEGMRIRLDRLRANPAADLKRLAEIAPFWNRYTAFTTRDKQPAHDPAALANYRWMVEEFRISLFAQELGTSAPASAKRLDAQWQRVLAT
jgi:ATP-dependent helicase HrpA